MGIQMAAAYYWVHFLSPQSSDLSSTDFHGNFAIFSVSFYFHYASDQ
jgi:hypothetical protein